MTEMEQTDTQEAWWRRKIPWSLCWWLGAGWLCYVILVTAAYDVYKAMLPWLFLLVSGYLLLISILRTVREFFGRIETDKAQHLTLMMSLLRVVHRLFRSLWPALLLVTTALLAAQWNLHSHHWSHHNPLRYAAGFVLFVTFSGATTAWLAAACATAESAVFRAMHTIPFLMISCCMIGSIGDNYGLFLLLTGTWAFLAALRAATRWRQRWTGQQPRSRWQHWLEQRWEGLYAIYRLEGLIRRRQMQAKWRIVIAYLFVLVLLFFTLMASQGQTDIFSSMLGYRLYGPIYIIVEWLLNLTLVQNNISLTK